MLGLESFAALGWSGGGPFALAAAAVMDERVRRVGVVGAPAPFQQVSAGHLFGGWRGMQDDAATAFGQLLANHSRKSRERAAAG